MADDRDNPKNTATATGARTHRVVPGRGAAAAGRSVAGVLATIVSAVTMAVVAVLAVHILFVIFEANPANDIVSTVADWADDLAWKFRDVFAPGDAKVRVAVNYGLAAVVYLIIGRVVVNLIQRFG